jgi:hypothetical protein
MPYTINRTNGSQLTVIQDGTLDHTTSLTLAGANYVGYGQYLNENFVYLLENGADNSAPADPLTGQLWYNTNTNALNVYVGTEFKSIPTITENATQPASGNFGDFWWDNVNYQLYVWSTQWQLIGPLYEQSMGVTGAIPTRIWDTNLPSGYHDCVVMQTGTSVSAIINNGTTSFVPSPGIAGFSIIRPGINLSTASTYLFNGTATNSQLLGGLAPSAYYELNTDLITTGNLISTGQLTIGPSADTSLAVTANVTLSSLTKNILISPGGAPALTANAVTGLVTVASNPVSSLGIATKGYVDTNFNTVQTEITTNVAALNVAINSNVAMLESLLTTLTNAFNANISSINTILANAASQSYVASSISTAMPMGVILQWSGTTSNIPTSWHLCDGTNGTPDLRDKFIVGAGDIYSPSNVGGSTTVTLSQNNLPMHTHTYTGTVTATGSGTTNSAGGHTHALSDPSHSHTFPGDDELIGAAGIDGGIWPGQIVGAFNYDAVSSYSGGAHIYLTGPSYTGMSMTAVSDHVHTFGATMTGSYSGTTSSVGTGTPVNTLPPYYALCFIMKIV